MTIKVNNKEFNNLVKKFQEGGVAPEAAPAEEAAPAPELGGDPMELILQAAALAIQTQDANLALQVCQALVEMAGGGAAPAEQAPEGQAPVYKKGGKLSRWILK